MMNIEHETDWSWCKNTLSLTSYELHYCHNALQTLKKVLCVFCTLLVLQRLVTFYKKDCCKQTKTKLNEMPWTLKKTYEFSPFVHYFEKDVWKVENDDSMVSF